MFQLEIADHDLLKNAFESISSIVDEITLTCDSEALHLRCLDKSHITFITMDLQKTVFDEYQCDTPEQIAIDCTDFYNILKKAKNNDILQLSIDDRNILIVFNGDARRKFKLPFIDMEYDNPQPPKMTFPCKISIASDLLKTYINDLKFFSDRLTFIIDEDYLKLQNDGQKGEGEIEYLHGENILEVVSAMFSIEKLQEIMKASKFSKECSVEVGDDMPLHVIFTLPTNDGKLEYLLAPRLEND